jgi:cell division protein FtsW
LPALGLSLLLLLAVLLVGGNETGAQSWFLAGSIQPSEFAKLGFVVYIAAWLASKGERIRDVTYGLIPFAILLGLVAGLILLQPDLGTAAVLVMTALSVFFIAGAELTQLLVSLLVGGLTLYAMILNSGYAQRRLQEFLNPGADPQGVSYQVQGIIAAVRAGGIAGRGLGAGSFKLFPPFLHHTDTIFSVIGEELGLVGCLIVVGLFLVVAYRGLAVAFRAPDSFGSLLSFGVTAWIVFQAIMHVGANTGALPFTGITLPFISYGGSSLTMLLAAAGLLLSVSGAGREKEVRTSATYAFGWRYRRPRLSRTGSRRRAAKRYSR